MNESTIKTRLSNLTLRKALWVAPIAFLIHIIEEVAFGFNVWRREQVGVDWTLGFFLFFNFALMAIYIAYILVYNLRPNRATALLALYLILTAQFFNAFYHIIFTFSTGVYSPGLVSGLLIYIPLNCYFVLLAYREEIINKNSGLIFIIFTGIMYFLYETISRWMMFGYFIITPIILIIYYIINRKKEIEDSTDQSRWFLVIMIMSAVAIFIIVATAIL